MVGTVRKSPMRQIPLSQLKGDLSRYVREAGKREIVITRRGKPAGVLIGFQSTGKRPTLSAAYRRGAGKSASRAWRED